MHDLFIAHSMLRFAVLLLGFANIVVLGLGLALKKPFGDVHRDLGFLFAGSLHLQTLLGLVLVATCRWYSALSWHLVLMLLAAVVAQASITLNRKRATPGLQLPLLGVVAALVLIFAGMMIIHSNPLKMSWQPPDVLAQVD